MRAFRFRLEAALDLRRTRDTEARRALADAQGLTTIAAEAVGRAEIGLREGEARALEELAGTHVPSSAAWHRNWMIRLRGDLAGAQARLRERQVNEGRAAERARRARRDLRVLERLRERAWQAYVEEERRAEQRDLDEFATLRAAAERQSRKELR